VHELIDADDLFESPFLIHRCSWAASHARVLRTVMDQCISQMTK